MSPNNRHSLIRVLINRRMGALLGLGFAAGLPSVYRLLGSTLQAWLGELEYDLGAINLFFLATLPLGLNFVWAPLLERYWPRKLGLGRRRAWLVPLQIGLTLGILAMALVGPAAPGDPLRPLFLVCALLAFLVASHDVMADAYRVDVLDDHELGAGAAWYVNGYRLGMLAAGAGALWLASVLPWSGVYLALAAIMAASMTVTFFAPEPPDARRGPGTLREAIVEPWRDLARRFGAGLPAMLVFVVAFRWPDSLANAMVMPLLQRELNYSLQTIAVVREGLGMAVLMLGAIIGGAWLTRVHLHKALLTLILLQAASNFGFLWLARLGHARGEPPAIAALVLVTLVENLCAGMVTAGFIAFLMQCCRRRYSASQYALFTSLMFAAGALTGAATGYLTEAVGYETFFLISVLAAGPALATLPWAKGSAASSF